MQKKFIADAENGQQELIFIRQQEEILNFSKLQILAHSITKALKGSNFLELQLVGNITGEYNDEGLYPGFYFDARTEEEGFTGVEDIYDYSDQLDNYSERVQYNVKGVWKPLADFNDLINAFVSENPSLEGYIYSRFNTQTFTPDFDSVIETVLTPEAFADWKILKEQHTLEGTVPTETPKPTGSVSRSAKTKKL